MLREQVQRFIQLIETFRVGNGAATHAAQAATRPTEQSKAPPPPQLTDIEAYVADMENPTHFEDWLKRFEMSLLCAAPNIGDKENIMVLTTKLNRLLRWVPEVLSTQRRNVSTLTVHETTLDICRSLWLSASSSERKGRFYAFRKSMQSFIKKVQVRRSNKRTIQCTHLTRGIKIADRRTFAR